MNFLIPFIERHLYPVLKLWIAHFNDARPRMSLGPGIPAPLHPPAAEIVHRHRISDGHVVGRAGIHGGLHHE
jgi:putative transposase